MAARRLRRLPRLRYSLPGLPGRRSTAGERAPRLVISGGKLGEALAAVPDASIERVDDALDLLQVLGRGPKLLRRRRRVAQRLGGGAAERRHRLSGAGERLRDGVRARGLRERRLDLLGDARHGLAERVGRRARLVDDLDDYPL